MKRSGETRLWIPGFRTKRGLKISVGLLFIALSALGFTYVLPTKLVDQSSVASSPNSTCMSDPASVSMVGAPQDCISFQPQLVGADAVPKLSLPEETVSNVRNLGVGGIVQNSPDNLTLYNDRIAVRVLGRSVPHDLILGGNHELLSSWSFWRVDVYVGSIWIPMVPTSNSFRTLGTNDTGSFLVRTMTVATNSYSGILEVTYKIETSGPLKWIVNFTPNSTAPYRFVYSLSDHSIGPQLSPAAKELTIPHSAGKYSLKWDDIPASMNATLSLGSGTASLLVNVGRVRASSTASLDPSVVSTFVSSQATAYTPQRKIVYDPKGGYNFVFYFGGNHLNYSSSNDGFRTSSTWPMPTGWPSWNDTYSSSPSVFSYGQRIVVASGMSTNPVFSCPSSPCEGWGIVFLYYAIGTLSGKQILWNTYNGQIVQKATLIPRLCHSTNSSCSLNLAIRNVSVTLATNGAPAFSYNLYASGPSGITGYGVCGMSWSTESDIGVTYAGGGPFFASCENDPHYLWSEIIPANGISAVRVVYQKYNGQFSQLWTRVIGGTLIVTPVLNAVADTYVERCCGYQNQNFGSDPLLFLKAPTPPGTSIYQDDVLVRFNTGLPSGAMVVSANLTFTAATYGGTGSDYLTIIEPSNGWNENSITFATESSLGTLLPQSLTPEGNVTLGNYSAGSTFVLNVTNTVRGVPLDTGGWTDNGFFISLGTFFAYSSQNQNIPNIHLVSNDGSNPPTLKIAYFCCIGQPQQIEPDQDGTDQFSVVTDANYGTHIVYKGGTNGNITYAYISSTAGNWIYTTSLYYPLSCTGPLGSTLSYPSLTIDYSTNDVYLFVALQYCAGIGQIMLQTKTLAQQWRDTTRSVIIGSTQNINETYLSPLFSIVTGSNASSLALTWTRNGGGANWVEFASVPVSNIWSPFASPTDPWDGNGIVPYGQYFQHQGESISTSTGLLAAIQTDFSVPGRGLDLHITRIYEEPAAFEGTGPLNYESYPWAPIGNGWALNFPWMSRTPTPLFVHLSSGEGYRIPSSFWLGQTSSFENHQGEQFKMTRSSDNSTVLADNAGTTYNFDSSHALTSIIDTSGNTITFSYNSTLQCITDTVGRAFTFSYSGAGVLTGISQVTGTCASHGQTVRTTSYSNTGTTLLVTDPQGRVTKYQYMAGSGQGAYLVTRITYPTQWYSNYTYTISNAGTEASTYRVAREWVGYGPSSSMVRIRETDYSYTNSPGGQIVKSETAGYNGSSTQPVGFTDYSFSSVGVQWNISDYNHNFLRGTLELFSPGGEIARQTLILTDGQGNFGSFTNFYQYDLWGNLIYSRQSINSISKWSHEEFSAYYNGPEPTGFYAFQESFSRNQGTAPDNLWNVTSGYWMVNNGVYNGTETSGSLESMVSSSGIGTADLSLQARVFIGRQINSTAGVLPRLGIFTHFTSNKYKWALDLTNETSQGTFLELHDEWYQWLGVAGQPSAKTSCPIVSGAWYTFNMTVHGYSVTGWASTPGHATCNVSGTFSNGSPAAAGNGFGLSAGGFSTLFDNITVTTVSPSITGTSFSNSFIQNGAPSSSIHGAFAGNAQLQNSTGVEKVAIESYLGYYNSGRLYQTRRMLASGTIQWLTTTATYDPYGNLNATYDPRGNVTTYSYSSMYQSAYLTKVTQTLKPGNVQLSTSYSYNFTDGTLLSEVDPRGYNTTSHYDILGRPTKVTLLATGDYSAYSYNDSANYVNVTNEMSWKTREFFDGLGRVVNSTRFLSGSPYSTTSITYNYQGEKSVATDELGHQTIYQYDAMGRITRVIEPDQNSTFVTYNDLSFWTRTTDQGGIGSCRITDQVGRLISVVENASATCLSGIVTNYYYDEVGNLIKTTTATMQTTAYTYDTLNRLAITLYADTTRETYTYDSNGNVGTKTDRNNKATSFSYDSLNRIANITYQGIVAKDQYSYDSNGNLLSLKSQNATLTYTYDSRNRVLCETYSVNGGFVDGPCGRGGSSPVGKGASVPGGTYGSGYSFTHYYLGETMIQLTYNDYMTAGYLYDGLGRVSSLQLSGVAPPTNFTFYKNDQIRGIQYGNSLVENYTYNKLGAVSRLTLNNTVSHLALMILNYQYNKTSTVASVTGNLTSTSGTMFTVNEQYSYDAIHRLVNSYVKTGSAITSTSYAYDPVGNRISQKLNGVITTYNYNLQSNELVALSTSGSSGTYSYDGNGNLVSHNVTGTGASQWSYKWTVQGNLLSAANSGSAQGYYAYDGLGRRVESKESANIVYNGFLGTETLADIIVTAPENDYVYADGLRIARVNNAGGFNPSIVYYGTDALGSTQLVTSATRAVLFSDGYQPFGLDNSLSGSETYRFTGKPYSSAIGLYYEYQRWYDPSIGRFISQDPLAGRKSDPQSLNPYLYVENLPTVLTDPSGMDDCGWNPATWLGCLSNVWNAGMNAWNSIPPEYQQGILLAGFIALTYATGGTDLLFIGGIFAAGGAGLYVDYTYAMGETPSLAGFLGAANLGFGIGTGIYGVGELLDSALSIESLASSVALTATDEGDNLVDTSMFWRVTERGGYDLERTQIHHLLPRQLEDFFKARGLEIDDYTVQLDRGVHMVLHGRGGSYFDSWNSLWDGFRLNNRGANASDVLSFLKIMLTDFGF